jgi:hypothetical protein
MTAAWDKGTAGEPTAAEERVRTRVYAPLASHRDPFPPLPGQPWLAKPIRFPYYVTDKSGEEFKIITYGHHYVASPLTSACAQPSTACAPAGSCFPTPQRPP